MKRTAIRRISKRRKPEYQAYLKERNEFLHGRLCEFPDNAALPGCYRLATTVHHMKGRAGKLLRDQMYWLPLCFEHHSWVENHKQTSRKMGLILYGHSK